MKIESLSDLFLHELQQAYAAERYIGDTIPKLAATAAGGMIPAADPYLAQARQRLKHLEDVLALTDHGPGTAACRAIEGTVLEAEQLIGAVNDPGARVAALFAVLERMKHDLLTRYVTLASWAIALGKAGEAKLLLATVDEERLASFRQATASAAQNKADTKDVGMGDRLTALLDRKG